MRYFSTQMSPCWGLDDVHAKILSIRVIREISDSDGNNHRKRSIAYIALRWSAGY